MPSGRTHDALTVTTGILGIPVVAAFMIPGETSLGILGTALAGYLISGLACSPDMDTESVVYYRWGFLRWLWFPYQFLIPHRSRLSHGLLLGPAIRLVYLGLIFWAWMALVAVSSETGALWWAVILEWDGSLYFLAGWVASSMLHSIADIVVSAYKKSSKRKSATRRTNVWRGRN